MHKTIILTSEAQQDLDDAYKWYQDQQEGLGKEFIRCIDAKLSDISRHPLLYQIILSNKVRRALISRFPFSIYFINENKGITVIAILHQRRSPDSWKSRAK